MATPNQIAANQRNAQCSTGPSTPGGIERTKYNATTHGLTSKRIVLPNEDPAEFQQLRADLFAEHRPEGVMELHWVDEIAACTWRLRRARGYEALALKNADAIFTEAKSSAALAFDRLMKYANCIERSLNKALRELRRLKTERRAEVRESANRDLRRSFAAAHSRLPQAKRMAASIGSVLARNADACEPRSSAADPASLTRDLPS